jgi:hypothetical protein
VSRRETEDVAAVFQRGGKDMRRGGDCHSTVVLRGDSGFRPYNSSD